MSSVKGVASGGELVVEGSARTRRAGDERTIIAGLVFSSLLCTVMEVLWTLRTYRLS